MIESDLVLEEKIRFEVLPILQRGENLIRSGYPPLTAQFAIEFGNDVAGLVADISAKLTELGYISLLDGVSFQIRKQEILSEGGDKKWILESKVLTDSVAKDLKISVDVYAFYISRLHDLRWDLIKFQEYYVKLYVKDN
jgi:hypothetical protein